jgi:hypothetical protein
MTQHTNFSSYREKVIEHLFLGELLKRSWLVHKCTLQIAKPEVDNSGYDFIVEVKNIVRHLQVKTSIIAGKTASQKVHIQLAKKPSGCVVWIYFNEKTLDLGPFYFFGASAGKPLPSLSKFKIAKHSKGNKNGIKAERPNLRVVPKKAFEKIDSVEGVYSKLFQNT